MNILLINHYAGSPSMGMEFRPYYFSKYWVEQGHRVTIVASSFSHLRKFNPDFPGSVGEQMIDGIRYLWLKGLKYRGNGARRALSMFAFVGSIFTRSKAILKDKPDLVIASSTYPLDIFPAWWIARKYRAKLVFEVHDLWPLSPMELGGLSKWNPFIILMQLAENFAYRSSDRVVSLLPCAKEHMVSHGMDPRKFSYIPNGISISEWNSSCETAPEALVQMVKADQAGGFLVVGYAGAHGIANALTTLLEAAALTRDEPIRYYLIGQGSEKADLIQTAESMGLNNVRFFDSVPKAAIPHTLGLFDALYVGTQDQPIYRFGISMNKIMDYMMAGKPIISAIKAGNDPVTEAGCGVTVEPGDATRLASALIKISKISQTEKHEMGRRGRDHVIKEHDLKSLSHDFIRVNS